MSIPCKCCGSQDLELFYEVASVPVHSCKLVKTVEASLDVKTGAIELHFCNACGFVQNSAFVENVMEYDENYESTQSHSGRFDEYLSELARTLVKRYDLGAKRVVEIGCGQGEFLNRLSAAGAKECVGYDPAYRRGLNDANAPGVRILDEFFPGNNSDFVADFIVCRHTLEHIPAVFDFLTMTQKACVVSDKTAVCFEVPDVGRILRENAFWDIYYEHCSYFSPGSLARLFRSCGFKILSLKKTYDAQYVVLEARLAGGDLGGLIDGEDDVIQIKQDVQKFARNVKHTMETWRNRLRVAASKNKRVALWGSGSKAMGFLTAAGVTDEIGCIVDINPEKHGFMQIGTRQKIVAPSDLMEYRPHLVIVMNSIYLSEIRKDIDAMGLQPEVTTL